MIEAGQHWRHKKRGSVYVIVETNCAIQASDTFDGDVLEQNAWVAYRNIAGGRLVFRMEKEFLDGRFELVGP